MFRGASSSKPGKTRLKQPTQRTLGSHIVVVTVDVVTVDVEVVREVEVDVLVCVTVVELVLLVVVSVDEVDDDVVVVVLVNEVVVAVVVLHHGSDKNPMPHACEGIENSAASCGRPLCSMEASCGCVRICALPTTPAATMALAHTAQHETMAVRDVKRPVGPPGLWATMA